MKKARKKQLSTKSDEEQLIAKMFTDYCDGISIPDIAEKYQIPKQTLTYYYRNLNWPQRRVDILKKFQNNLDEQIRIAKENEAMAALMIKDLNVKRMMKEYDAYKKKGRMPSFLGTSTSEYRQNLDLARMLLDEDNNVKLKINGKVSHTVAKIEPEKMTRILEAICMHKGIPLPSDENTIEVDSEEIIESEDDSDE